MAEAIVTDVVARVRVDSADFIAGMQAAANTATALAQQLQGLADGAKQSTNSVNELNTRTSLGDTMMRNLGIAAGMAGGAVIGFSIQAFNAAARVGELDVAMKAVGNSTGLGYGAMKVAAQQVKSMGIEMASAQEMVLLFAKANIELSDASKIARVAQDLAVISQSNSTETATRLTYAIMNQDTQMLRGVGITKSAAEAFAEYAASHHMSVRAMTELDKKAAITNMIIEEGAKVAGTYEAAMREPAKVLRSFPRLFNDIQVAVGGAFKQAFGDVIMNAYDATKAFVKLVEAGGKYEPVIKAIGMAFQAMLAPIATAFEKLKDFFKSEQALFKLGETARGVHAEFRKGADAVSSLAGQIQKALPFIAAVSTFLAMKAGASLLAQLPVVGSLLGGMVPFIAAFATLVMLVPSLQQEFMHLISAVQPLIPVIMQVGTYIATILMAAINQLIGPLHWAIDQIQKFGEFLGKNIGPIQAFAATITILTAAYKAYKIVVQMAATVQKYWNMVMAANPVGLVILAIALLVAAFVWAYKTVDGFAEGFQKAFNFIVNYVGKAVKWVLDHLAAMGRGLANFLDSLGFDAASKLATRIRDAASTLDNLGNSVSRLTAGDAWGRLSTKISKLMETASEAVKKLTGDLTDLGKKTKDGGGPAGGDPLGATAGKTRKRAKAMADAAREALQAMKDEAKGVLEFAQNIQRSMQQFGAISTISPDENQPVSAEMVLTNMQQRLAAISAFADDLKKLREMGLNNASLQEIVSAGPVAGDKIAKALIAAGQEAISQANTYQAGIETAGLAVGDIAATSQFGYGVATAAGIIDNSTNIEVKDGAIRLTVNGAVDEATEAKLREAIKQAIKDALKAAAADARRRRRR